MKKISIFVIGLILGVIIHGLVYHHHSRNLYGDMDITPASSFELIEIAAPKKPPKPPKNGWYSDQEGSYFFSMRKKLTGWQEIEENWYFFDEDGKRLSGFLSEDGIFYLDPETGIRKEGLLKLEEGSYYFYPETGLMASSAWLELDQGRFYASAGGRFEKGRVEIEGQEYFFDLETGELLADLSRPLLALTYDDGPSDYSHELLDILKKHSVKASFFFQGYLVETNEDIIKRVYQEGHSVGSHSFDHPNFNLLSGDEIIWQIEETDRKIEKAIGIKTAWFRSPYGESSEFVRSLVGKPTIHWNIDSQDWMGLTAKQISDKVQEDARDGGIVLLHDTQRTTIDASKIFIPALLDQGYQLVNLETLFMIKEEVAERDGLYNGFD